MMVQATSRIGMMLDNRSKLDFIFYLVGRFPVVALPCQKLESWEAIRPEGQASPNTTKSNGSNYQGFQACRHPSFLARNFFDLF